MRTNVSSMLRRCWRDLFDVFPISKNVPLLSLYDRIDKTTTYSLLIDVNGEKLDIIRCGAIKIKRNISGGWKIT